jgi:small-conductance mechanosensitive channel
VPNGEVFTSRVTNNTASPNRRASVFVFLEYNQDLERALAVILDAVTGVTGVAAEPAAAVRLHDLTAEHLHIEAAFSTISRRTDFVHTASEVRIAIVQALTRAGIPLPHPRDRRVTIPGPRGDGLARETGRDA